MSIVVSLTTIPSRLPHLGLVIKSIKEQSIKPDHIQLYVPREYNKRSLGVIDASLIPKDVDLIWVEEDLGPATKVLPAVKRFKDHPDVKLIYCDDDKLFDRDFIKRLLEASDANPNACIVEFGWNLLSRLNKIYWHKRPLVYKVMRLLTLGYLKAGNAGDGSIQIAEGCGGVLVKPHFFNDDVYDIPDILWNVDDIWLSGWLAVNQHPIIQTNRQRNEGAKDLFVENQNLGRLESLYEMVYKGHSRLDADYKCIRYMQEKYGIWV